LRRSREIAFITPHPASFPDAKIVCTPPDAYDISAYAGQTGQLLFSVPPQSSGGILDNIQFSSTPVPEPGTFGLFAMGGALLAWRRLKL
jgi:hypothetical protein